MLPSSQAAPNPPPPLQSPAGIQITPQARPPSSPINTLHYTLTATQVGSFQIPTQTIPLSPQTQNHTLPAIPITVHPLASGPSIPLGPQNKPAFLSIQTHHLQLYSGQHQQAKAILYLPTPPSQTQLLDTLSSLTISTQHLVSAPARIARQIPNRTIDGDNYQCFQIPFQYTINPTSQAKTISLGPAQIQLQIRETHLQGPSYNPQRSYRTLTHTFRSGSIPLQIQPLPQPAPTNYQGAIGNYQLQLQSISPQNPRSGEPIYLEIRIQGQGDLPRLPAPQAQPSPHWSVEHYSTSQQSSNNIRQQGHLSHIYLIRPRSQAARQASPPPLPTFQLISFNPQNSQYHTHIVTPPPLTLRPGTPASPQSTPTAPSPSNDTSQSQNPTILEPQSSQSPISHTLSQIRPQHIHLSGASLILVLSLLGLLKYSRQNRQKNPLKAPLKQLKAIRHSQQAHEAISKMQRQYGSLNAPLEQLQNQLQAQSYGPQKTPNPALTKAQHQQLIQHSKTLLRAHLQPNKKQPNSATKPQKTSQHLFHWLLPLLLLPQLPSPAPAQSPSPAPTTSSQVPIAIQTQTQTQTQSQSQTPQTANTLSPAQLQARIHQHQSQLQVPYNAQLLTRIANDHQRLNQNTLAKLWYTRALIADPHQPQAQHNLQHLNIRTPSTSSSNSTTPPAHKLPQYSSYLHTFIPILWWLSPILLLTPILLRLKNPQPWRISSLTSLLLSLIALGTLGSWGQHIPPQQRYIHTQATPLYSYPSSQAPINSQIPAGSSSQILAQRGNWYYIEDQRQATPLQGWVQQHTGQPLWPPQPLPSPQSLPHTQPAPTTSNTP